MLLPKSPDTDDEPISAKELVERYVDLAGIDRWLKTGPGKAYETSVQSDDLYGAAVVSEIHSRGYEATGRRGEHPCMCSAHNGLSVSNSYYTIRITRRKENS